MGAAGPAARREEGEYRAYSTDEQRSRRAGSARFGDGRLAPRAARRRRPGTERVLPDGFQVKRVSWPLILTVALAAGALAPRPARADEPAAAAGAPTPQPQ